MRGDVLALDPLGIEVLFVNLNLVLESGDIRDINFDGAIAEGFHELVILQPSVLRFVGMSQDHFVNVRLSELLWLDFMLLRSAEKIIEKGHIEFEHLDKLDQPAVGNVELAIE